MFFDPMPIVKEFVARLAAPATADWLNQGAEGRVFQVFDRTCNLVNSNGAILSLVSTELGPGPFAITVDRSGWTTRSGPGIWGEVTLSSKVRISPGEMRLGYTRIDLSKGEIWNPNPAWEDIIPGNLAQVLPILDSLLSSYTILLGAIDPKKNGQIFGFWPKLLAAGRELSAGIQENNLIQAKEGAKKMAGLGHGLTPAGDDFLLGSIYSLWSGWDSKRAKLWTTEFVQVAVPRTTQLSATWLRAAAGGEAADPWHQLVEALIHNDPNQLVLATRRILATGHSSGLAALTGYLAGLAALSGANYPIVFTG